MMPWPLHIWWQCRSGLLLYKVKQQNCAQVPKLVVGFTAEKFLADKGCDTEAILEQAAKQGMLPAIPPKKASTKNNATTTGSVCAQGIPRLRVTFVRNIRKDS